MNTRLLLLDFFHEYLKEQGVTQASFCYLDRKYKNNLSKFFYNEEYLNIYHVKAPRVFNKRYEYKQNIESILDFVLELQSDITLDYNNLDNLTKDVYYLKSLKNIQFKYLHIKYINTSENYTGVLFLYSNQNSINLLNKDVNKIFKQIIESEEESLINSLNNLVVKYSKNYLIENDNGIYLSEELKTLFKLNSNFYDISNKKYPQIVIKINEFKKTLNVICSEKLIDSNITFFNDIKINNNLSLRSINDLLINKINDHFTLLYLENISEKGFDYLNYIDILKENLSKNLIDSYHLYDINDGVVVIINGLIELSILEKIKLSLLKQIDDLKIIYLNTAYDINKNINLNLVLDYLKNNDTFSKQLFKEYYKAYCEVSFISETNVIDKNIFNSFDSVLMGKYFGYEHLELLNNQKLNYYLKSSKEVLNKAIEQDSDSIYLKVTYQSFKSKKIWYQLNKIKANNKVIILSEIEITSKTEFDRFLQVIDHLHEINFNIYFDSSVYCNIMMSNLINLYEGIYVENYEMSLGYDEEDNLFQNIIVFYLKNNKKIILNQEEVTDFEHPNIYYIK